VKCFRLCAHCNKEYEIPLERTGNATTDLAFNFGDCPHCKVRDDVWIMVKQDHDMDIQQRAEKAEANLNAAIDAAAEYKADVERLKAELADRDETLRVMRQEMGLLDREGDNAKND